MRFLTIFGLSPHLEPDTEEPELPPLPDHPLLDPDRQKPSQVALPYNPNYPYLCDDIAEEIA